MILRNTSQLSSKPPPYTANCSGFGLFISDYRTSSWWDLITLFSILVRNTLMYKHSTLTLKLCMFVILWSRFFFWERFSIAVMWAKKIVNPKKTQLQCRLQVYCSTGLFDHASAAWGYLHTVKCVEQYSCCGLG